MSLLILIRRPNQATPQRLMPSALADMMARRPRIDLALPYLSESYAVHPPPHQLVGRGKSCYRNLVHIFTLRILLPAGNITKVHNRSGEQSRMIQPFPAPWRGSRVLFCWKGGREGYQEGRRCSRDTYPEPYDTKYTSTRK